MNITVLVALITALAAVVSPNIAEVIRSRNERKIKRFEMIFPVKREAYTHFAACYAAWREARVDWQEVLVAVNAAMLYANDQSCASLKAFISAPDSDRDRLYYLALERLNLELKL